MTRWDNIYKNYQKDGEARATLSEEIHPLFKDFLQQSDFEVKQVLDIGSGTGKYLKFLQADGFKTDGIDSSETAVTMTRELLADDSIIVCEDMFKFVIPDKTYDLIISVSTLHHGTKEQVQTLIANINEALLEGGKVFITLPDFETAEKWNDFKDHERLAEGTFSPLSGPEKGLPHSFFTKEEVHELFSKFRDLEIQLDEIGRWIVWGSK